MKAHLPARRGRRAGWPIAAATTGLLALAATLAGAVAGEPADPPRRPWLFKDARGELALARVRGETTVLLVIAAASGRAGAVAEAIAAAGGEVQFRDDEVDYLRARVALDTVDGVIGNADVISAELSIPGGLRSYDLIGGRLAPEPPRRPVPEAAGRADACPAPDLPLTDPYSPLRAMGAEEFLQAHPGFDGRGVTIALLDGTPDLLLPELQSALTLEGQPQPKIVDVLTVIDPGAETGRDAAGWVTMRPVAVDAQRRLLHRGISYVAQRSGQFRIGTLDESRFVGGDLDRDGNPEGSSRLFGVLWDRASGEVWVDTDQDRRFDDEAPMRDYGVRSDIGVFGRDDPDTAIRESIPFAIQTGADDEWIAVLAGYYPHPTKVIGAAIGSRGAAGRFDGVAPGARLLSIRQGSTAYGHVEGAILALRDPRVDILVLEQHSTVEDSYSVRDGRLVLTIILERLAARYGKLIVAPASNVPALNAVTEIGQARGVLTVGAVQSRANFLRNRGLHADHDENMHGASSFGPGGDGALKPDLVAPSDLLSTTIAYAEPRAFGPGDCYLLPPGYTLSNGTSTSATIAAAAAALLISAARQRGIAHDAERIRAALLAGARHISNLAAHQQGAGMIDVGAAWNALRRIAERGLPPTFTVQAPVRTALSHLLSAPHHGTGLFESEGWSAGERGERRITLTRTSGSVAARRYALRWEGNDGSFGAPESVVLPLNVPVTVPITVAPAATGVHSALLVLHDPDFPMPVHRVLATVVAPVVLKIDGPRFEETLALQRTAGANRYIRSPAGAGRLEIELEVPLGDAVLIAKAPDGRARGWGALVSAGRHRFVIPAPQPGTWEVIVMPGRDPSKPTPLRGASEPITATLAAAAFSNAVEAAPAPQRPDAEVADGWAPAPTHESARKISTGEQHVYEVDVVPGTAMLLAGWRVSAARPPAAAGPPDLDLYAFDCSGGECEPAMADARPQGEETLRIAHPAPGRWKIVVDAFQAESGTIYDYFQTLQMSPEQ